MSLWPWLWPFEPKIYRSLPFLVLCLCMKHDVFRLKTFYHINIVAAFRGMHVSPAKHSYAWLPRKCDYRTDTRTDRQTDGRTDRQTPDKVIPMCNYASQVTQKGRKEGGWTNWQSDSYRVPRSKMQGPNNLCESMPTRDTRWPWSHKYTGQHVRVNIS